MMEEKVKKMQDARQDAETKKKGLTALLNRETDPAKKKSYQDKLDAVDRNLAQELQDIDDDNAKQEAKAQREI